MGYMVSPKSRNDIYEISQQWKRQFGLENRLYLPVIQIFEILPDMYPGLKTEIVEDWELPANKFAETEIGPCESIIRLKQSVYDGAYDGGGFERMTIMHEVGHYEMIANQPVKLYREFDGIVPAYADPEWQAKCFAGEVMVDRHAVHGMSPEKIAKVCGVSMQAAIYQWNKYNKKR